MEMEISFPGGLRVDASYRGDLIRTDQPVRSGGEGSAPPPFSLFLASIGTCVGIYVLRFCQKRGIPTENVRIVQRMQKNPDTRMIDKISLEIQVPPDFPEKYHAALVRTAEQCAVKRHIDNPPVFETAVQVV